MNYHLCSSEEAEIRSLLYKLSTMDKTKFYVEDVEYLLNIIDKLREELNPYKNEVMLDPNSMPQA